MIAGGEDVDIKVVWNTVAVEAKQVAVAPAFFRAIEKVVPIAFDGNVLVIGLDALVDGALQGALNSSDNLNILHKALRQATGNGSAMVRVIEGTTLADWANAQGRDAAIRDFNARQQQRSQPASSSAGWDSAIDSISAMWQQSDSRTSPIAKGKFVLAAVDYVTTIAASEGLESDGNQRSFQRSIERIASCAQIDPVVVAMEALKRL